MFFHTSALTVGMTKNGAITSRRTMPLAEERLVEQQRERGCRARSVIASTEPTSTSVFCSEARKAGSVRK